MNCIFHSCHVEEGWVGMGQERSVRSGTEASLGCENQGRPGQVGVVGQPKTRRPVFLFLIFIFDWNAAD